MKSTDLLALKNRELQEWAFNLSKFVQAMKDGSFKYEREYQVSNNSYDDAFLMALHYRPKFGYTIEVVEEDQESFTLHWDRKTQKAFKSIQLITKLKS